MSQSSPLDIVSRRAYPLNVTMSFVTKECLDLGLRAGAILFRDVRVAAAPPELRAEIVREVETIRKRFADPAAIRATPEVASFAEVLKKVGVNPRRDQPSVERLLTFALKRGDLPTINGLVDAYNLVSVRSYLSLGAHDRKEGPAAEQPAEHQDDKQSVWHIQHIGRVAAAG